MAVAPAVRPGVIIDLDLPRRTWRAGSNLDESAALYRVSLRPAEFGPAPRAKARPMPGMSG